MVLLLKTALQICFEVVDREIIKILQYGKMVIIIVIANNLESLVDFIGITRILKYMLLI